MLIILINFMLQADSLSLKQDVQRVTDENERLHAQFFMLANMPLMIVDRKS